MKFLDLTAGFRGVWFNKSHPNTLYIDHRAEVNPDLVLSINDITSKLTELYTVVVFDPPHVNFGANAKLTTQYGHTTTQGIKDLLIMAAEQSWYITEVEALLIFKWNTHDIKLETALNLLQPWWEPLFGHNVMQRPRRQGSSRVTHTYWVVLEKAQWLL